MKRAMVFMLVLFTAQGGWTQAIKFPAQLEKLAAKAAEVVDINLDRSMLRFASAFLNKNDPDDAQAKRLISNLNGIYVRSYEFANAGEYNEADLAAVREQLPAPEWSRIVGARSKRDGENVDIFVKSEGGKVVGMVILASEPKELTFVNIDGPIDPEQLSELGGQFGIPKLEIRNKAGAAANKSTEKAAPK